MSLNYGLHIIENPSGTFSFVGSVPAELAYTDKQGHYVSPETIRSELRLPASYRNIRGRSFATRAQALECAATLGYEVDNKETE